MIIDKQLLDTLSSQAKSSPRLRQAYDLRNPPEDNSQRMLNALEPGTVMPIHRHRKSSETICMVRGKMIMRLYDDKGNVTDEFVMAPISLHPLPSIPEGECNEPTIPMVHVGAGQWHSLEVLEGIYINQGAHTDFVRGRRRMVA
ncbi:MAG: WbuC family cupin fold metalloprotein [Prevotellaceae bacterium]|nr:WbuC family cupin fold metalloprotein [Candidatus Faecinaster equi]